MLQDLDGFPSASWYFQRKVHCLLGLPIDILHWGLINVLVASTNTEAALYW